MIYAGCDLGITSAKGVVTEDFDILACEVLPYKSRPVQAASEVMERTMAATGLSRREIDHYVATGFGGKAVPGADESAPPIMCLHRAIRELNRRVRTVIDVGGHTFTAFNILDDGRMGPSSITDTCAAGIGRFIESMADLLELPLNGFSDAVAKAASPASITGQCVVLSESDVISLINDGIEPQNIAAGIASSVAAKIAGMVRRIDVNEEVALVGGVAKNTAITAHLENELGLKLGGLAGLDPQLVGAFGAALMARELHSNLTAREQA